MNYNVMKATVKGTDCEGEPFTESLTFTLIPPTNNKYYGTGYYMQIKMPTQKMLIDVRYEKTKDVEILADRWIKHWYGRSAQEIQKVFPE